MKTQLFTLTLVLLLVFAPATSAQDTAPAAPLDLIPDLEPITATNAARLQPLAMLGVDLISDAAWSPDNQTLVLAGSTGLWRYDVNQPDNQTLLIEGYSGLFRSVEYSSQGVLATGSDQGVIRLWDTDTWQESSRIPTPDGSIECLVFSPDGTQLAIGSETGTVTLWDMTTQKILWKWTPPLPYESYHIDVFRSHIQDMDFDPASKMLAITSLKGGHLFNSQTGEEKHPINYGGNTIAFSANGQLVATRGIQGVGDGGWAVLPLELWDTETGQRVKAIYWNDNSGNHGNFPTLAFNTANSLFIAEGEQIIAWSLEDLFQLPDEEPGVGGLYSEPFADASYLERTVLPGGDFFRLSPNETTIAVVKKTAVQLVDVKTGIITATFQLPNTDSVDEGQVYTIAFNPTRPLMAYGNAKTIRLINTETGLAAEALTGHEAGIVSLTFSHDGKWLFSGGGGDLSTWGDSRFGEAGGVRVWNMDEYREETVLIGGYEQEAVSLLRSSVDSKLILTSMNWGGAGGYIKLWDWQAAKRLELPDESAISFVVFSPYELIGAVIVNDTPSRVLLWDIQSNLYVTLFETPDRRIGDPQFSPNGKLLAIPCSDGVRIWNVKTGKIVGTVREGTSNFAFSPDSQRLAYTHESGITLVEIPTEQAQTHITVQTGYLSPLFFNQDGSLIFYNGNLWDTNTGKQLATINGGSLLYGIYGDINPLTMMSPDGKLLAYSNNNGVRLWGVPKAP